MSLLESRDAFPSQADPHATRWLRQHALSEMPAGHVVSQPSGHAARHLHVEQLRIHLVRIRRPTRGWSGPVGLPVVWYGRLREDDLQDTARFWGARAARGSSTCVVRLVRDVGVLVWAGDDDALPALPAPSRWRMTTRRSAQGLRVCPRDARATTARPERS